MSRLDSLPADQRATLQLLLKQGKSYDELATLLRLEPDAVRDRALDALDALGPDTPAGLPSERQDELSDYLLGQQSASEREGTRAFLEGSAAGRAWARVVAGELRELAPDGLPEIPAEGAEVEEAFDALHARREATERHERSSKLGGALVLGAVGIVLAVVLVLALGVFGGGDDDDADSAAQTQTTSTTATTADGFLAQINLTPVREGSKALGAGFVVAAQEGGEGLQIAAQGLPESNRYAVWLYTSPSQASFLGFSRYAGSGRIIGVAPKLPDGWREFKELVVTREPVDKPSKPGRIVLRGPLQS